MAKSLAKQNEKNYCKLICLANIPNFQGRDQNVNFFLTTQVLPEIGEIGLGSTFEHCTFWARTPVWPYGINKKSQQTIASWPFMQSSRNEEVHCIIILKIIFFHHYFFYSIIVDAEHVCIQKQTFFVARLDPTTKRLKHLNTVVVAMSVHMLYVCCNCMLYVPSPWNVSLVETSG